MINHLNQQRQAKKVDIHSMAGPGGSKRVCAIELASVRPSGISQFGGIRHMTETLVS